MIVEVQPKATGNMLDRLLNDVQSCIDWKAKKFNREQALQIIQGFLDRRSIGMGS